MLGDRWVNPICEPWRGLRTDAASRTSLRVCGAVRDACVRCQSACAVHRPNVTRARNAPFRIAPAPLRNRQIAFGCGRFLVRCISHRCVPLRGRWAARLAQARGRFRAAVTPRGCLRTLRVRLRRIFPPKASLSAAHSRLPVRRRVRAPAPFPPRVRWRASCTCPFLRCASRAP